MIRSRKFKEQRDRPPHRPLTMKEVEGIARKGGIDFANRAEQFSEFEQALDFIRCRYKPQAEWKRLSLTDKQIRDRLVKKRTLAGQLHELHSDPALNCQTRLLIEGEDADWRRETPSSELELLTEMIRRAELGLEKLKERSAKNPNDWAIPVTKKLGRDDLLVELIHLWQVATSTLKPQAEEDSPLIPFLHEGARVIAQQGVEFTTVLGWARRLIPRAYKHLDLGYLPLRPIVDPAVQRLLLEAGPDALTRLF